MVLGVISGFVTPLCRRRRQPDIANADVQVLAGAAWCVDPKPKSLTMSQDPAIRHMQVLPVPVGVESGVGRGAATKPWAPGMPAAPNERLVYSQRCAPASAWPHAPQRPDPNTNCL